MVETASMKEFLEHERIAVLGASDEPSDFGRLLYRQLRAGGHGVVAVNPATAEVEGDTCYPSLSAVPDNPGAAVVLAAGAEAKTAIRECAEQGVRNVWLFKGKGAMYVATDVLDLCEELDIRVVETATR